MGRWTDRLFALTVLAQAAIVVTGGLVRLTSSGLGCPTWPRCTAGSYVAQPEQGLHGLVEFSNRMLTFALGVVVLAAIVAAWRHRPRRRVLVVLALAQLGGIVVQAVLGGVTVLTGLSPLTVAAHFLVSTVLVGVATVLHVRGQEGDGAPVPTVRPELRATALGVAAVTVLVLVLGTLVTGSGPHSGDVGADSRLPLAPASISWLHADAVILLVGLVVALLLGLRLTAAPALPRRRGLAVLGVLLAQGLVGYVQYATGLPVPLVAVHMAGACATVVVVVRLLLGLRERAAAPLP